MEAAKCALAGFVAAYAVLVTFGATCQFGYINADFVGYATVAHPDAGAYALGDGVLVAVVFVVHGPAYLCKGVDDLIAGRVVLMAAGAGYVMAIYGVARRFLDGERSRWGTGGCWRA